MIRKLIVLPSPQRADYRRHTMKHSAEIGNCFFSVNKSIRCTVPGIKHIFQGYGPIFQFRAAGAVMKWNLFGWKNWTRTQNFHKFRNQKTESNNYHQWFLQIQGNSNVITMNATVVSKFRFSIKDAPIVMQYTLTSHLKPDTGFNVVAKWIIFTV